MKSSDLRGLYTATITPVNQDRTLDVASLHNMIDYYAENDIQGILAPSSSGEFYSMTTAMKRQYVEESVKASKGRIAILANVSDDCPSVVWEATKVMADLGADAVVCQPPHFHGFSQEEIKHFFWDIADRSPLPVILYDHLVSIPTKPTVETVVEICTHENIIGIKDTHRDPERSPLLKKAREEAHADFEVMNGGDGTAAVGTLCGFGLLNALSAVRPDIMHDVLKYGHAGDVEKAMAAQEKVNKLMALFSCLRGGTSSSTLFAMSLKIALERKGLCGTQSVIYGFEANDEDRKAVYDILDHIDD